MISNIPKVTIYRVNKVIPGVDYIEVMLQFRNPNMGQCLISFQQMDFSQQGEMLSQMQDQDPNAQIFEVELPKQEFRIDPSETYMDTAQSTAGSVAESATTNIRALVATCEEDQRFVYKKNDNWIILCFRVGIGPGFRPELQDIFFGFQMVTSSSRYNKDPFTLTNPMVFNCGKAKVSDAGSVRSSTQSMASGAQSTSSQP